MNEDPKNTYRYRILRYTPNLIRDEWVNIGVLLEEVAGEENGGTQEGSRVKRAARLIQEDAEIGRVRRLHPAADENMLRALPAEFDARLTGPSEEVEFYLRKLDQTLSNVLQLSPYRGLLANDFDTELDRLFRDHVGAPPHGKGDTKENTRGWIRLRLSDVFRRHRILSEFERSIRVEEFTQPGDPMRIDYAYENGKKGFVHAVALGRDPSQAKVLAYTAECIRARFTSAEFTAVTEVPPEPGNPRHQFVARLFEDQNISLVPLNHAEKFAEELRRRIH
jgi:hypothetical protein